MTAVAGTFGSATALRGDADRLRRRADAAERLARAVRGTDVGSWTGEASDAFAEALADAARNFLKAADDALAAATALDRHAAVVEWADDRLVSAVPMTAAEADLLLEDLREAVDDSARAAAAALDEVAQGIERMPDVWDFMAYARDQLWGGIGDTLAGVVESSWQVQLFRYATDPLGYVAEQQAMGQALWTGLHEDPVGLAKDMVDWDTWRTEPLRAIGRQVPDIILSAATAGGGSAAAGARRATDALARARTAATEAPGVPASPSRTTSTDDVVIDRTAVSTRLSVQRQARHVEGDGLPEGASYFRSMDDARQVLDDFHSGVAEILGLKGADIVIRTENVTGYNNNVGAGYVDQPTHVFFIKGTRSPSVVPYNPEWTP